MKNKCYKYDMKTCLWKHEHMIRCYIMIMMQECKKKEASKKE